MTTVEFKKALIEIDFERARNILLNKENISIIQYTDFDHTSFDSNNQELLNAVSGQPIVYCIWVGKSISTLSPKYVGHAGSKIARQRIRSHFTKKHDLTGAQLDKIIRELKNKNCIGFSKVIVDPPYMRKALEDWFIEKDSNILEWNLVGKRKSIIKDRVLHERSM